MIHIKEDQADVFKIAENIIFFFFFSLQQIILQKHWYLLRVYLFPDLKSYFYGSQSPFRKAFSQTCSWKVRGKTYRSIEVMSM